MASRQPSTVSPFGSPVGVSGFAPRRRPSRLARWGYTASWACIGFLGTVGLVFSLYRNDSLLALSRRAGLEARYLELEQRLLGKPGWGTPRSLAPPPASPAVAAEPVPPVQVPASAPPAQRSTSEGVAIVSLDALPPAAAPPPPAPEKVEAPPVRAAVAAARPARAATPAPAPVRAAAPPAAKPPPRPAPPPPVAAAPAPANENPLKAAIRSAIVKESGQ